jgi:hypothetical protein
VGAPYSGIQLENSYFPLAWRPQLGEIKANARNYLFPCSAWRECEVSFTASGVNFSGMLRFHLGPEI